MKSLAVIAALIVAFFCVDGTRVRKCRNDKGLNENQITLGNCTKPPCRVPRRSKQAVEIKFKPETDVQNVRANVFARLSGVPFPFLGVDGTNVCDKIRDGGTGEKTGCPLKSGHEYLYRDSFDVLDVYPLIKVLVHWALKGDDKDVICFEVMARIVKAKN